MIVLAGGTFADLYEKFNNRKESVGFKTKEESKNNTPSIEDFYSIVCQENLWEDFQLLFI